MNKRFNRWSSVSFQCFLWNKKICGAHHLFFWKQRLQKIGYLFFCCTFCCFRFAWRAWFFLSWNVWLRVTLLQISNNTFFGYFRILYHHCMDVFRERFWLRTMPTHIAVLIVAKAFHLWKVSFVNKMPEVFGVTWCKRRFVHPLSIPSLWFPKYIRRFNGSLVSIFSMLPFLKPSRV